jgi:hypothetical protein
LTGSVESGGAGRTVNDVARETYDLNYYLLDSERQQDVLFFTWWLNNPQAEEQRYQQQLAAGSALAEQFWKDLVGYTDAKNCVGGSAAGCGWTLANFTPGKVIKGAATIVGLTRLAKHLSDMSPWASAFDVPAIRGGFYWAEKTELHHVLPQQYRGYFESRGLNIDEATIEIPSSRHGGAHDAQWNDVWGEFIANNPNATAAEIVAQASSMMRDYNLDRYVISVRPYGR